MLNDVPELAIMEMSLKELQSFTINFNIIRRRLGLADEANFANQTQKMMIATYEHHFQTI